MVYFLYALFFISCIILVGSVLLQPGKTDAGALFTSNVSSTAFGPRGTATILSKVTIVAASVFMLSALLLAMPALTGNVSVLNTAGETTAEAPAAANTNTAVENVNAIPANPDSNGALIETPATNAIEANSNSAPPANN